MMLRRMFDDVVSVARPGSSDGGSAPQLTVISCFAALSPDAPSSLPPHAAAATRSPSASAVGPLKVLTRVYGEKPGLRRGDLSA